MSFPDQIPPSDLVLAALKAGLALFEPEPHIWETLRLLPSGNLVRPIDMFGLALHAAPWPALVAQLARMARG